MAVAGLYTLPETTLNFRKGRLTNASAVPRRLWARVW